MLAHGDPKSAAKLLGYVEGVFAGGYSREPTEQYTYELLMTALRSSLKDDDIAALERVGADMSELQAVRLATRSARSISGTLDKV